ncbi:MAG TPA: DUF4097 family beta strand repeat-containing protein [Candidatus Elarobacter sp.]|nr:DUF4097 family beta strand repeat-containing protein [Candidatus Elarobacter sp.]
MQTRYILGALVTLALPLAATPAAAQQNLGRDGTSWRWDGPMTSGAWFRLFSVNGPVHITPSSDGNVHVRAEKQARSGGDPTTVHYAVVRDGNDLTICAMWSDRAVCEPNGMHSNEIHMNDGDRRQNVNVAFEIQVPNGVRTSGNTINGDMAVERVSSDVIARTVNGEVRVDQVGGQVSARTVNGDATVTTRGGPVNAETVNGSVHAKMGTQGTSDMRFRAVNGAIDITAPASLNANVELSTVNGDIDTKYALNFDRRRRHADGVVGSGGPMLRASTVNGSIALR